jgi:hypothetical protein
MKRLLVIITLLAPVVASAQSPADPAQKLAPEEIAFARLPAQIRQMLAHMSAAQAMQTVAQTGQHAIALGNPYPTPEQFRGTLGAVLRAPYSTYASASAGATSFPPLSPLVAPPPPPFLR